MNETASRILARVDAEQIAYYRGPIRVTVSPRMLLELAGDEEFTQRTAEGIRWAAERKFAVERAAEAGIAGQHATVFGIPVWIDASLADDDVRVLWDETTRRWDADGNPLPPPAAPPPEKTG